MKFLRQLPLWNLVGVAIVGLTIAACDDVLAPERGDQTSGSLLGFNVLEVTPPGPLTLVPGDTVALAAPRHPGGLAFSSSDETVAVVSEGGVVTALQAGSAQISVRSSSDPLMVAVVLIQVGSRGPSTIRIDTLEAPSGALRLESVTSALATRVAFQRGDATQLEILIGDRVVCAGSLPRTAPFEEVAASEAGRCTFDTAAFDPTTGTPLLRNGTVSLTARLVGGRRVLAVSAPREITLANHDTIAISVVPERRAADEAGRVWFGGNLDLVALPVIYSGEDPTTSVTFEYYGSVGRRFIAVDEAAPFRVTIPATTLIRAIDTDGRVQVRSGVRGGGRGFTASLAGIRYDGAAPPPGRLIRNEWMGENVLFSSLFQPDNPPDEGVGLLQTFFRVGTPSLSFAQILAAGTPVQRGGDLQESEKNAYRVAYQVCDALLNCTSGTGFDFGVDLRPPTIVSINHPNQVVNPTTDLRIQLKDDRSDLPAKPLEVLAYSYRPSQSGPVCGRAGDALLPGSFSSGICLSERTASVVTVPTQEEGYYIYRITAVDVAGNRTSTIERAFLVDRTSPAITSFTTPTQYTAAANALFRASATDNIDLGEIGFGLIFGTGSSEIELPLSPPASVGTPFTGALTRSADEPGQFPFIRSLTVTGPAGREILPVDRAVAIVTDAAGRVTRSVRPIPSGQVSGSLTSSSNLFSTLSAIELTTSTPAACTLLCTAIDRKDVTLTTRISGDAGLSAFARVFWFLREPNGTVTRLASTVRFSVVDTGTQRTYTYTHPFSPPAGANGRYSVFVVAMSSSGNAIKTAEVPVDLVAR